MITRRDVEEEIQRIESGPPTMQACERLAVLYFVREHIGSANSPASDYSARAAESAASYAPTEESVDTLGRYGESDFLTAVNGSKPEDVMAVLDELMTVILAINPQLYQSVMRRLGWSGEDYKHS